MKRQPYPTGWEHLATFTVVTSATGTAINIPTSSKWRKYVIGVAGGAGADGVFLTYTPSNQPTALECRGDHPTFWGPYRMDVQMYARSTAPQTINVTIYGSVMGEIDELVRYLENISGSQDWDNWVEKWQAQDIVETEGITFFTSGTRNHHPIMQAPDGGVTGGAVFGVLPERIPFYWVSATVRVFWSGSIANQNGDQAILTMAFERMAAALDIDADSYGADYPITVDIPATSGALVYTDFLFTKTAADGLCPGEAFRIRLQRNTAGGADDYTGAVEIHGMAMWIDK